MWRFDSFQSPPRLVERLPCFRKIADSSVRKQILEMQNAPDEVREQQLLGLLKARQKLAVLRTFPNWATYAQREGIIKDPVAVDTFLQRVSSALQPGIESELARLQQYKPAVISDAPDQLEPWDVPYLREHWKSKEFELLHREAAPYLTVARLLGGMTRLVGNLFGLQLQQEEPRRGEVWDGSVLKFVLRVRSSSAVSQPGAFSGEKSSDIVRRSPTFRSSSSCGVASNEPSGVSLSKVPAAPVLPSRGSPRDIPVGILYVDLWARAAKVPMLAQFTVRCSRDVSYANDQGWNVGGSRLAGSCVVPWEDGSPYQTPCAALICNFNPPHQLQTLAHGSGASSKSLLEKTCLSPGEARSFFHEFGHTLHALLSHTELQHLSGSRGAVDFAEFPSHLFEHYSTTPEGLAAVACHKDTGAPIPPSLAHRLCAEQRAWAHLDAFPVLSQAAVDQAFYSFVPAAARTAGSASSTTTELVRAVVRRRLEGLPGVATQAPQNDKSILQLLGVPSFAQFDHLVPYGGSYYCYLFSMATAAWAWESALSGAPTSRETGARLQKFLEAGSCESDSLAGISSFANGAAPGRLSSSRAGEVSDELLKHPELIPLGPFLNHCQPPSPPPFA
eukprot:GHVT01020484.1.p1 GENE.GHVT01020484.1~~GHVT01020484.1.p1  ORF type:complete len:617 (-),score=123.71 GHVT01020484.1:2223-4073(-)